MLKHITVVFPNVAGQFHHVAEVLAEAEVNIWAHHMVSVGNSAVLQMVCLPHQKAVEALADHYGFYASEGEIVALRVKNDPGHLRPILEILADAKVNISHSYCAQQLGTGDDDIVLFDFEDPGERGVAIKALTAKGFSLVEELPVKSNPQ